MEKKYQDLFTRIDAIANAFIVGGHYETENTLKDIRIISRITRDDGEEMIIEYTHDDNGNITDVWMWDSIKDMEHWLTVTEDGYTEHIQ